jgi:hypothetical protein
MVADALAGQRSVPAKEPATQVAGGPGSGMSPGPFHLGPARASVGFRWMKVDLPAPLFHRITAPGKLGRMTQTWERFDEGWRIVVGHVSVIDQPAQ